LYFTPTVRGADPGRRMTKKSQSRLSLGSMEAIELSRPVALGVVQLLGSAQVSLKTMCGDELCVRLLDKCITHLRERFGLAAGDPNFDPVHTEASLTAVVRLLVYVRVEVIESLSEMQCADLLNQCIDHLLQSHLLFHEQFGKPTLLVSH
jgi:hypothetical protein